MDDIIARTDREYFMTGEKFLSTSSASKIYINLDIPETAQLKERFQEEASTIELISNKEIDMGHFKAHEMKIEDLHYLNAKEIKGQKFKVHAKINGINMRKGCMRLNLTLEDESEKLEAVVFGALAEKLSRYQLTSSVISKGVHNDQLPEELKAIINEEYIFTVGLTDQASDQVLLKYKIFAFSSNSPAPVRDNKFKGKDIAESKYKDDETEDAAILTSDAIPTDLFCDESPAKKLKPSICMIDYRKRSISNSQTPAA
ncbi:hypothetical protein PHJA_002177200 [Phtheirospermum japonicum]|uniref:Uncharacterized protein n=1 Tax=Phtheirospermum japonicum TaxID=374723 RepID=A0A830D1T9_9LAMI|nr:hypothetical protein PHJA_002177200 [Phtheirospermum japonicum]